MKEILKFLAKWFGVVLIGLFAFWMGTLIWNGVKVCPECNTKTAEVVETTDIPSGEAVLGEESICKFAEDFDSEGLVVPSGTIVEGPAFVKPDRNLDWAYPVYVGETYETEASDEVVWLLTGDDACVDAQSQFFSFWGKTKP
jgi:hypothetical protein